MDDVDATFRHEVARRAELLMRSPAFEPFASRGVALFRFAIEPSFGEWQTIQLLRHREHRSSAPPTYMLTRRRWLRTETTADGEPVIRCEHRALDAETAVAWSDRIERIAVPMRRERLMGIDGVTYELGVGSFFDRVVVRWWGDGPPAWRTWTTTCLEMIRVIDVLPDWTAAPIGTEGRVRLVVCFRRNPPSPAELFAVRKLHWRWSDRMPAEILTHVDGGELVLVDTAYDRMPEVLRRARAAGLFVDVRYLP